MRISRVSLAIATLAMAAFGWAVSAQPKPAASSATSIVVYKSPT